MSLPSRSFIASPRGAVTAAFVAFGAVVGLWVGSVPAVMAAAGISSLGLGVGITIYTIAYVFTMYFGSTFARFASNRTILLATMPLIAVTAASLLIASNHVVFFVSLILLGAVLGIVDLFMNAEASYVESDLKKPVFTAFHGSASLSTAIFAILGSLVTVGAGARVTALVAIALVTVTWVFLWRNLPARHIAFANPGETQSLRWPLPLILLALTAGFVMAGETAALMWSAKLLDEIAPALAALAGLGAGFFCLCNATVRFAGDLIRRRIGDLPLILVSLALAALGFILIGSSPSYILSVAAFAITGFGTACIIPSIFAIAALEIPDRRAAAIGIVSLIAGLPRTLAPWVFGWIAGVQSTSLAFGLCAVAMAAAFAIVVMLNAMRKSAPAATQT
jgi:predicted MFS family arabinose efflux permease